MIRKKAHMRLCKWDKLPDKMKNDDIKPYYDILYKRKCSLACKRIFDVVVSALMLVLLLPVFLILAIAIKLDSKGPVFYRQIRVTQYGREFKIHKFRSMFVESDKGTHVTVSGDTRITRVGKIIRNIRLDEIAQLIDVFKGDMTFVGVRPEVPRYVESYTPEMMATLLLPAGVTNLTSIYFSGEAEMLDNSPDPEKAYVEEVLPKKMKWNLKGLIDYSFFGDIKLMFMTFFAMCGKDYSYIKD